MRPKNRDLAYLWDIREAGREIASFVKEMKFVDFERNKLVRYAVERQLLVIGEAANRVSTEFRNQHPDVPWRAMIAQRNVLAHEYGEILVARIWLAATESVPALLKALETLLPE
jgi:uncharacterized protein with HEPN domain